MSKVSEKDDKITKSKVSEKGDKQKKTSPKPDKTVDVPRDVNYKSLVKLCKSFVTHTIQLSATFSFDKEQTPISNCNAVGDILEDIFYPRFKKSSSKHKNWSETSIPRFLDT